MVHLFPSRVLKFPAPIDLSLTSFFHLHVLATVSLLHKQTSGSRISVTVSFLKTTNSSLQHHSMPNYIVIIFDLMCLFTRPAPRIMSLSTDKPA